MISKSKESNDNDNVILRNQFELDGYLYLEQILSKEFVSEMTNKYGCQQYFDCIFQDLYKHGHTKFPTHVKNNECALQHGVKNGFREIVMRSPGRYEISINEKDQEYILSKLHQESGLNFVPQLLNKGCSVRWEDCNIVNVSLVVSTPGASDQGWHADGAHIRTDIHLPCHCFNIFIPLCDVITSAMGPTELRPQSHYITRNLTKFMLLAKARKQLQTPIAPLMKQTDCLIFDYRVLHRGLANTTTNKNRTVLVITVAESWFKDNVNYPSRSIYDNGNENMLNAKG